MAVTLPTCPYPNDYQVLLRDFGGVLTPFLGGPEQRINRIGTRFGLRVVLPSMDAGEGQTYIARLLQGRSQTVILPFPIFDLETTGTGTPLVRTDTAGGSTIPLKGMTVGYPIKEGQFFHVVHSGQRYIYMATAATTVNGSGNADLPIFPILRTGLTTNDVVNFETPMIEGFVSPGDDLSWQIGLDNGREIAFSVMEIA
ncbi:hypothetical protein [Sphingosinicella xenopeptidilytica]|uniref:Uncharacterized protein n=1 Tax=Sphingosinicella xenopeptidilytica TaxID=364098 RepID=A0ABW3C1G0_SPHXN